MENDERKLAIKVGVFIFLGLAIFILGIFTLGGQQKSFVKNIHLGAVFNDVSGLKKGNNVWFSGVKVGTISSLHFTGVSQVDVKMDIDENVQAYIHRNAGVRISSDGLIGNKIIVIDGGSPQAPIVQNGDMLQAEKVLSTDDIMKTIQQNSQNLLVITNDFKTISGNMVHGKGMVGALISDPTIALQFRNAVKDLQATTANTARMANELGRFTDKLNSKGGLADNLLTDTSVFHQLKLSVAQLKQTTANTKALTDNLNRASSKLNSSDNVLGVLLNDQQQATQIKSTLNYLNQSTIKLNDDLEAAQHNFLLKGFFKKRAKQQEEQKAAVASDKNNPGN